MIQDDVENDVDASGVGSVHQRAQVVAGAEVRIHIKKVLDPIAVIGLLEGDLLENRPHPDSRHAHPPQIAKLGRETLQVASDEHSASVAPACGIGWGLDRIPVIDARIERRRSSGGNFVAGVVAIALLLAVREPVGQQEAKHLVFPGQRRGMKLSLKE